MELPAGLPVLQKVRYLSTYSAHQNWLFLGVNSVIGASVCRMEENVHQLLFCDRIQQSILSQCKVLLRPF